MVRVAFREVDVPGRKEAILSKFKFEAGAVELRYFRNPHDALVFVHLEKDDPELPRLRAELQRLGIFDEWTEAWYDGFTEEELDAAPRLIVCLPIHPPLVILGGADQGTRYDLSQGCPACGAGSPQVGPLFIWDDEVRHLAGQRIAKTATGDIIVSDKVADSLGALGTSGLDLRSVHTIESKTKRDIELPWRQLSAKKTAPQRLPRSSGLYFWGDKQCQVCKRESFSRGNEAPLRLYYRASDIAQLDDVSETWEVYCETHLGSSVDDAPLIGRPWLLVTPRVMRAMQSVGFTKDHCEFIPIRVVDE
jgi:hypothetical protein